MAARSLLPFKTVPPDSRAIRRSRSWSGSGFCCSDGSSMIWTSSDVLSTWVLFS